MSLGVDEAGPSDGGRWLTGEWVGVKERATSEKMTNFKYFPINFVFPYEQAIAVFVGDGLDFSMHYRLFSTSLSRRGFR